MLLVRRLGTRAYQPIVKPNFGFLVSNLDDTTPVFRKSGYDSNTVSLNEPNPRVQELKKATESMIHIPDNFNRELSEITRESSPQELRQAGSALFKSLQSGESHRPAFSSLESDSRILATFAHDYASISQVLQEAKARLGDDWNPKRVLEIGFGPAVGTLVANELFTAEKNVSVVLGHYKMRRRAAQLLRSQNEDEEENNSKNIIKSEVPAWSSSSRYDLIIAAHQLYQSTDESRDIIDSHSRRLFNFLNPGGVLVLIERGDTFGFESIARARQVLLRPENVSSDAPANATESTASTTPSGAKVIAPCVHHAKCPLQMGVKARQLMKNPGSQNWCRFSQSVQRPRYLLEFKKGKYLAQKWVREDEAFARGKGGKAMKGSGRPNSNSHETANHSYLVLQKTVHNRATDELEESPESNEAPRIMRNPLKRKGHVIMEVCAPSGNIEHWTVTKSQGKEVYRSARNADQGDIWPLGSKSVQQRGGLTKPVSSDLGKEEHEQNSASSVDPWESNEDTFEDAPTEYMETLLAQDIDQQRAEKLERRQKQNRLRSWN